MPWSHTHDVAGYLEAGNGIQPGSFVWLIRNPSWVLRVSCVVGRPDWAWMTVRSSGSEVKDEIVMSLGSMLALVGGF